MNKTKQQTKKADYYDDGDYNYLKYWDGRDYEHAAEELAIRRLLKGRTFAHAVDIGGGYGRLCLVLRDYADKVTLAEPSKKQLAIAKDFLKDTDIEQKLVQADAMPFADGSVDLFTMIRVMHHLPDPMAELRDIHRALSEDGVFILELANNAHALNRLRYATKGKRVPRTPVDIRSEQNKRDDESPFVNHHPKTVIDQLTDAGFKVEKTLSVSNLRSPALKKLVPKRAMLHVEKALQRPLAKTYFGPSTFFLLKKG